MDKFNNRILIIDDNESIHDDFSKTLVLNTADSLDFEKFENYLSGKNPSDRQFPTFKIDSAYQGKEGLEFVQKALDQGLPYALAFVDIRMPPGWDGIETIENIWAIDPNIQTVICTAHSDYSWEEMFKRLGHSDRLLILKKPFDLIEIRLATLALTKKWALNRQAYFKREELQEMVNKKTKELALSLSLTKATLESTADGIFAIDKDDNILLYNKNIIKIWDVPETLFSEGTASKVFEHMQQQIASPTTIPTNMKKIMGGKIFGNYNELTLKTEKYIEQFIEPQYIENEIVGLVYSFRDITQRKRLEQGLAKQATYDLLTGLPNRLLLVDRAQRALAFAKRNNTQVALLLMDLDSFKYINDSFGHPVGDELLKIFAQRLRSCLRSGDSVIRLETQMENETVARLGGDEFVAILTAGISNQENILLVAQRIYEILVQPYQLAKHQITSTVSIGISIFPNDGMDPVTLIKNADLAMYAAKKKGKGHIEFYTKEMSRKSLERVEIENELRQAMEKKELFLAYQPIFDLRRKCPVSLEVLLRWNHPKLGIISPTIFIPIAESNDYIISLGKWILETACAQNKAWQKMGLKIVPISVNVSGQQFKEKDIVNIVKKTLEKTGLEPQYLELELTENILMTDVNDVSLKIQQLKELGVLIDIDDFGTGYSSLSFINQFPINKIKIDQSFIKKISYSSESQAIVQAIIMIAKTLKIPVVAEGVEDSSQIDILRAISTDQVQGFYFSLPLSEKDTEDLLKEGCHPKAKPPNN